jgi:hypothetical protein
LYNCQQAACKDPAVIWQWFTFFQSFRANYGIADKDTWNFDESDFLMDKTSSQLIVTDSEKSRKQKKLQAGNCKWVMLVQSVGVTGHVIPSFFIFVGKVLMSFRFNHLTCNWVISFAPTGWINNNLVLA